MPGSGATGATALASQKSRSWPTEPRENHFQLIRSVELSAEVPRETDVFLLTILPDKGALLADRFIIHVARLQSRLLHISWLLGIAGLRLRAPVAIAAQIASVPNLPARPGAARCGTSCRAISGGGLG